MKLHLTTTSNQYLITAYGEGYVEINRQRFTSSLIVTAEQLILDWEINSFAHVSEISFERALILKPEVLLLGTGNKHQFLHPKITQNISNNGVSIECMTTVAACRTYNILMSEGRDVAAMLII